MCDKCMRYGGWIMLILGVLFLLRDMGQFNIFGNIGEWAIVLIVIGACGAFLCGDSATSCSMLGKGKKKKK